MKRWGKEWVELTSLALLEAWGAMPQISEAKLGLYGWRDSPSPYE